MKAVLCKEWGTADSLVIEDIAVPEPGRGEVRIRVHAAGLNFADTLMIQGLYQVQPTRPFSPGYEVAGIVDACGADVSSVRAGDRVMAPLPFGGYAEYVVAEEKRLFRMPEAMSFVEGAAFTVAYGTSNVGLRHRGQLRADEVLLVHGAAGGVGLAAVEIGHHLGALVIATAGSAEKLELAATHGADHGINYRAEDIRERVKALTDGQGADVIYDPVGGDVFDASLRCINWEGRLLIVGFAEGRIPSAAANYLLVKNCAAVGVFWGPYMDREPQTVRDSMHELIDWYQDGALKPHVSHVLPLEQVTEGLQLLLSRQSMGRVVLQLDQ